MYDYDLEEILDPDYTDIEDSTDGLKSPFTIYNLTKESNVGADYFTCKPEEIYFT
jgi:hypothetical protein